MNSLSLAKTKSKSNFRDCLHSQEDNFPRIFDLTHLTLTASVLKELNDLGDSCAQGNKKRMVYKFKLRHGFTTQNRQYHSQYKKILTKKNTVTTSIKNDLDGLPKLF